MTERDRKTGRFKKAEAMPTGEELRRIRFEHEAHAQDYDGRWAREQHESYLEGEAKRESAEPMLWPKDPLMPQFVPIQMGGDMQWERPKPTVTPKWLVGLTVGVLLLACAAIGLWVVVR